MTAFSVSAVTTDPPAATVAIAGVSLGTSILVTDVHKLTRLDLRVSAPGYAPFEYRIFVRKLAPTAVRLSSYGTCIVANAGTSHTPGSAGDA